MRTNSKRQVQFNICLTQQEKQVAMKEARKQGESVSQWARGEMFGSPSRKELAEMLEQLIGEIEQLKSGGAKESKHEQVSITSQ